MYQQLINEFKQLHQSIVLIWLDGYPDENVEDVEFSDIELYDDLKFDIFTHWSDDDEFKKKKDILNQEFAGFGERGDGSHVAMWLMEHKTALECPIVLIGSEGELGVIAPDYLTFLQVISKGYDMYQLLEWRSNDTKPWAAASEKFMDYLATTFNLRPIIVEQIPVLVEQAREQAPDLEKRIRD